MLKRANYIVICKDTDATGDTRYVLATCTVFDTREGPAGADKYAAGISPSREPMVVEGFFANLRFDAAERFGENPCKVCGGRVIIANGTHAHGTVHGDPDYSVDHAVELYK